MPENKTIHDLPIAEQTNASDVFETEIPSQLMQSGYASRKVTMSSLENHILGTEQYETQLSNFPQGSRSVFSALEYARQSGGGGGASVVQKTMAEYTALPTSAKMNGSIYKITDKALIYCLDEEYHAVLEITSANYALLTSDEKNNGTLYIITDEETTAVDIPYSSGVSVADKLDNVPTFDTLTTSDNKKILSSFVENNEVVVKAVGIETITLTPQTGINVSGSVKCKKFGNIAVVSIQNVTFANTGVNQLLIKGAPKALETVYSSKPAGSNLNNTNNIAPNVAYVDNNGDIYFNIHSSNTTQHWISLVYPCEQ